MLTEKPSTKHHVFFTIERILLFIIVVLELAHFSYLIQAKRLVLHDTFIRFYMQYYFLNNVVVDGEIPQWIPYLTHGTTSVIWQGIVGMNGILNNALFLAGGLLRNFNFLSIFYAGIFVDKMLLLAGTWLLSKYYFRSPYTTFFVSLSVMFSSIWMSQSFFNFHSYYALPLIIYFFHLFLDKGLWRYCFLSLNLFALQILDKISYFLPVTALVIFLYFITYFASERKDVVGKIKEIKMGRPALFCLFFASLSFLYAYLFLQAGMDDQLTKYIVGRNIDGSVPLTSYLNYGNKFSLFKWIELLLGFSPGRDYTLYVGLMNIPFVVLGLFCNSSKKRIPFIFLFIVLTLISYGTIISTLAYYAWPLMKYFRHLYLLCSINRLFVCFLAGFGFNVIAGHVLNDTPGNPKLVKFIRGLTAFLILAAILIFVISVYEKAILSMFHLMKFSTLKAGSEALYATAHQLKISSLKIIIAAMIFILLNLAKSKRLQKVFLIAILGIHAFDIYSYYFFETSKRTISLNTAQHKILEFQKQPFHLKRSKHIFPDSPRTALLTPELLAKSSHIWILNLFLFHDQLGTSLRTDHLMRPLDYFLKAYGGQSLNDNIHQPSSLTKEGLIFPQHPAALKFSGFSEEKIQLFSQAYLFQNPNNVAKEMVNPTYKGDALFLLQPKTNYEPQAFESMLNSKDINLSANHRLSANYQITQFSSNHIEILANNPLKKNAWLFYSDVWDPHWKATRNNQPADVYQANLAYKAVALVPGENKIHFHYSSPLIAWLNIILSINCAFWLGMIIYCLLGPEINNGYSAVGKSKSESALPK